MNKIHIFLTAGLLILGYFVYDVESKTQHIITVDLNAIFRQTAQTFAKQNLREELLERRLGQFRAGLDKSLKEFASVKNVIIVPKSFVYGRVPDLTDAFVAYHNGLAEGASTKGKTDA
jgi:hypothetical protein